MSEHPSLLNLESLSDLLTLTLAVSDEVPVDSRRWILKRRLFDVLSGTSDVSPSSALAMDAFSSALSLFSNEEILTIKPELSDFVRANASPLLERLDPDRSVRIVEMVPALLESSHMRTIAKSAALVASLRKAGLVSSRYVGEILARACSSFKDVIRYEDEIAMLARELPDDIVPLMRDYWNGRRQRETGFAIFSALLSAPAPDDFFPRKEDEPDETVVRNLFSTKIHPANMARLGSVISCPDSVFGRTVFALSDGNKTIGTPQWGRLRDFPDQVNDPACIIRAENPTALAFVLESFSQNSRDGVSDFLVGAASAGAPAPEVSFVHNRSRLSPEAGRLFEMMKLTRSDSALLFAFGRHSGDDLVRREAEAFSLFPDALSSTLKESVQAFGKSFGFDHPGAARGALALELLSLRFAAGSSSLSSKRPRI